MYECVKHGVPYVLAGSIRDDGPLPDTIMDLVEAQDRYAEALTDVGMAVVLSTMLHGIGVGNMLPVLDESRLRRHQPVGRDQAGRPRLGSDDGRGDGHRPLCASAGAETQMNWHCQLPIWRLDRIRSMIRTHRIPFPPRIPICSSALHETAIFWYLCKVLVGPGTPYLGARHHESDPELTGRVEGGPNGPRITTL